MHIVYVIQYSYNCIIISTNDIDSENINVNILIIGYNATISWDAFVKYKENW